MQNPWASGLRFAAVITIVLCAVPSSGYADFIADGNRYCSAGGNPGTTADTVPGSLLAVDDVQLVMVSSAPSHHVASNCYGSFGTVNSSPATETSAINEIFGPDFVYLDKTGGGSNPAGLGGVEFKVHTLGGSDGAPGLWAVTWEGAPAEDFAVDLVVLLVGGNNNAAYLLSNVLISTDAAFAIGAFDIQFFNGSGQNAKCYAHDDDWDKHDWDKHDNKGHKKYNVAYGGSHHKDDKNKKHDKGTKDHEKDCKPQQPSLSHLTLFGRIVPTVEVPEPASMTMFGAGLLGLWALRRRRR